MEKLHRWLFEKGLTTKPPPRIPIPGRTLNTRLTSDEGRDVVMIETLSVRAGDFIDVRFDQVRSDWRQGVWLGTMGMLELPNIVQPQFWVWSDTAPPLAIFRVRETQGLLHFYNVFDAGRFGTQSQGDNSGMVLLDEADGWRRYGCSDVGRPPNFEKLIFSIRVRQSREQSSRGRPPSPAARP